VEAHVLRITRSRDGSFGLGLLSERFDTAQVLHEVERAYRAGDLLPGMTSLVVYEPGLEVAHVSVADLIEIRDCVARHESACPGPYRGLFVAAEREAEIVARVYAATWHGAAAEPPMHDVAATLWEAELRLATGALSEQLAALRCAPVTRRLA
jgi:hypothetical protein